MNGVTSSSMRDKGVQYRMNFGVDILRLKQISLKYSPSKALAELMWKEDVRELKILATMLYPHDEFSKDDALRWGKEIFNQEIREQVCKNLFQDLVFAGELVEEWIECDQDYIRSTGYWLFARLCITRRFEVLERINVAALSRNAKDDLGEESLLLCQSALNALRFFGRISPQNASVVMALVAEFEFSNNPQQKEIFEQLSFEFE